MKRKLRAHCFQHETFEDMAALGDWLSERGFDISYTRFFESQIIPPSDQIDWLIIMGGSMSVNDEQKYPWLSAEKSFVRECIQKGKKVVGICLGAQMIASSLGARVYPNEEKEIGWFPVFFSEETGFLSDKIPSPLMVFHWHGETFDLPEDAVRVAWSEGCKNQIFTYGDSTIAFQCHLETTERSLDSLSTECSDEIVEGRFIQSEERMKTLASHYIPEMQRVLFSIMERFLKSTE